MDIGAGISHGTDAGYQLHLKRGIEPCAACRAAKNEYQRQWRVTNPVAKRRAADHAKARDRALRRLAHLHPLQLQALLNEELDR